MVILNSKVEGVFCAGADLKERVGMSVDEVTMTVDNLRGTFTEFENLPMATIAVLNGVALGGGLELALCADLRIGGDKLKAGLVETSLAIIPGAGGTQRLPRLIGASKAKELIFMASVIGGDKALQLGMINSLELNPFEKAVKMAKKIAEKGPIAIRMAKAAINQGMEVEKGAGLAIEKSCYAQLVHSNDRIEGILLLTKGLKAFSEKRTPSYKGN